MVSKESSTLAKEKAKFLHGLFCNGLWQRTAECHKKETRIKGEGKFEEKYKRGFLSSCRLSIGYGAGLEMKDGLPNPFSLGRPLQTNSPSSWP